MKTVLFTLFFFVGSLAHALPVSEWTAVLNEFRKVYEPIAESQDKKLEIQIEENNVPIAGVSFDGQTYVIKLSSNYLDQKKLDQNTLRLVLCHEAGHFFGGDPRRHAPPEWDGPVAEDGLTFISSEGQADYYATHVCFPKIARTHSESGSVPDFVRNSCINAWTGDSKMISVCEQASLASKNFLQLFYDFEISFETPDISVTPVLIQDSYPGRQCRLDTLFRGALGQSRPACWFK